MGSLWSDEHVFEPSYPLFNRIVTILANRNTRRGRLLRTFTARIKLEPMPRNIDKAQLAKDMGLFYTKFPVLDKLRNYAESRGFRMWIGYEHITTDWSKKPPFRTHQYRWTSLIFLNNEPPCA